MKCREAELAGELEICGSIVLQLVNRIYSDPKRQFVLKKHQK